MLSDLLLSLLSVYVLLGVLLGVAFISIGLGQVDHSIRGFNLLFRLLVLPGAILLWPLVSWRWWQLRKPE